MRSLTADMLPVSPILRTLLMVSIIVQAESSPCLVLENTDYNGYDIGRVGPVANTDECNSKCVRKKGCKFWTFVPSNGYCMFKTSDSEQKVLQDRTSGPKCVKDSSQRLAEGYFTNDGNAFGYPHRKEYLHITFNNGEWQGIKIVGDANVPRGKVSFKTVGDPTVDITKFCTAMLQVRQTHETWNDHAFSWMNGIYVKFDKDRDQWFIQMFGGEFSFSRVSEMEALNAAKNPDHL